MNTGDYNKYDAKSFKFLPVDLNIIKTRIPDPGADPNNACDNFSNR